MIITLVEILVVILSIISIISFLLVGFDKPNIFAYTISIIIIVLMIIIVNFHKGKND